MMRSKNLIVVALLLSFGACSKKDIAPQQSKKIFTLAVDPALNTLKTANWLFIHDVNGQLIFYKTFEGGDTVIFNSSAKIPDEKISVTLMEYTSAVTYKLTSYLQISPGEVWTLLAPKPTDYITPEGSFQFTVYGAPSDFLFSDRNGVGSVFKTGPAIGSYTAKCDLYPNAHSFLISTRDAQDNLRYKFLDSVKNDSSYSIAYSDMKTPETILPISFSAYSVAVSVQGFDEWPPTTGGYYVQSFYDYSPGRTSVNIGYPSRLKYFRSNVGIYIPTESFGTSLYDYYAYYKSGSKPSSITFPLDAKFSIANRYLKNYAFTANVPFVRRESTWIYDNSPGSQNQGLSMQWTVHSPDGTTQKIGAFPSGFTNNYPELKLVDTMLENNTTFYLSGATTYEELISSTFKGQTTAAEREFYFVSVH
jgi:hypothetical protein